MRVVLDTNILVRANPKASPSGLARELLMTVATGPHTLILSTAILTEIQRVLTYPHVHERWPLSKEAIEQYLLFLEAVGEMTEASSTSAAVVRDPDDDPILQTAVSGHADVLCTRDAAFGHPLVEEACRARAFASSTTSPLCKNFGAISGKKRRRSLATSRIVATM